MICPLELAKPLAYWLIIFGCLLAMVTAFEPEPTGAWHLASGFLVCGIIPYIIYGSFTEILQGCQLVLAGTGLLVTDLLARFVFDITAAGQAGIFPAIWLCTLLVLLVLPAGVTAGHLLARATHSHP